MAGEARPAGSELSDRLGTALVHDIRDVMRKSVPIHHGDDHPDQERKHLP